MYALFGGILGAAFILGAIVAMVKEPALWVPTAVMGLILTTFLSWLATTTLTLAKDTIHYRSLFVRTDVPLRDVITAKFITGFSGYKPFQRIVVTVRENSRHKEITINAGLFDPGEIKRWIDALNLRISQTV
jgi:hypothetical protein